ncbi:MAG: hypothetical protein ACO1QB_12400 [Verrucomicrobiales bacterium]
MNFDEIEKLWRSPINQPSTQQIEKEKMNFVNDLKKKHLGQIAFCAWIFAVLAFLTGKIIVHIVWPDPALDPVNLKREWSVVPYLALPWIALVYMVWQLRRHRREHVNYDRSIQASIKALLDENRMARNRNKFMAFHLVLTALATPLVVSQIKAVGKAGDEINVMYWGVPVLLGAIICSIYFHQKRKLLPKKQELETLLRSYESEGPAATV